MGEGGAIRTGAARIVLACVLTAAIPGVAWAATLPGSGEPSGAVGVFTVSCKYSHRLPDDPIVRPRTPGASHMHDFLGNTSTSASSTLGSLRAAPTRCRRPGDRSAYWVPTLYQFDQPVSPLGATVYYRTARRDPAGIAAFPPGLRVIAGNARATDLQPLSVMRWECVEAGSRDVIADPGPEASRRRALIRRRRAAIRRHRRAIGRLRAANGPRGRVRREIRRHRRAITRARRANRRDGHNLSGSPGVPRCPADALLKLMVDFPECWNGAALDSADHRSHLAYAVRMSGGKRVCPASHRVPVPKLGLSVRYPTRGGPSVRLASGQPYTAHADFFNAWNSTALEDLVHRCLRADVHCQ